MTSTLEQLNAASPDEAMAMLDGVYEHSPWVARQALAERPFKSLAHLKLTMSRTVAEAGREQQLALVRAHPELAGSAMPAAQLTALTADSAAEQTRSGLTACTAEELARLQALNAAYNEKFRFPFVLAVRGPRGSGLSPPAVIETMARRLQGHPDDELAECLRQINRIAELRLDDRCGATPTAGNRVWDWAEALAVHSDQPFKDAGQLTVTYLTDAHRACSRQLLDWMKDCGFDQTGIDAVGNVWGRYLGAQPEILPSPETLKTLYTGSHYDTVRNGGKYDGRLGILVPMEVVRQLTAERRRLPYHLELIGFAEEEGQRFAATFLGSGAVIGQFDPRWLDQTDADGTTLREAMLAAGLDPAATASCRRDLSGALGFIELHIEQGPVLDEMNLPLGVVTSINGSVRMACEVVGVASHAGTTPMNRRRDAVGAVAELALYLERRAAADGDSVATIGVLQVPAGSVNVVPGRCRFSLDMRAPLDAQRDRLVADVLAELRRICEARGLQHTVEETLRAAAAPSHPDSQQRWERAVQSLGLPVHRMPSGAGHDAMKMHEVMPQAMLFVRGGNGGISHNPLESITADDAQLCVEAFRSYLEQLAVDTATAGRGAAS